MNANGEQAFIKAFGENLVKLRNKIGLTQEQLAHKAELNVSHLRKIEKGEINTGIGNVYRIAKTLDVSPIELLEWF